MTSICAPTDGSGFAANPISSPSTTSTFPDSSGVIARVSFDTSPSADSLVESAAAAAFPPLFFELPPEGLTRLGASLGSFGSLGSLGLAGAFRLELPAAEDDPLPPHVLRSFTCQSISSAHLETDVCGPMAADRPDRNRYLGAGEVLLQHLTC